MSTDAYHYRLERFELKKQGGLPDNFNFWVYMCINALATKGLYVHASLIHTSILQKVKVVSHSAVDKRKTT